MFIVKKTKAQLYNDIPLFTFEDLCKQQMQTILQENDIVENPDLFKTMWNCKSINKLALDNYNWETCYEFWQIHQFHDTPNMSLYNFIKLELYKKYFNYWENIVLKTMNIH